MSILLRFLFQGIMQLRVLSPVLRPVTRLAVSLVAIPVFRFLVRRAPRVGGIGAELEKDLEQWFRGAVLLLIATRNMEEFLFGEIAARFDLLFIAGRLLLAIGVIEGMPDQSLFSIIHPGPSMLLLPKGRRLRGAKDNWRPLLWGCLAKHLNRSSPVFAILAVLFHGPVGWVCYFLAITQYLVIALGSSRDAALDALAQFDRELDLRRAEVLARVEPTRARSLIAPMETAAGEEPEDQRDSLGAS